METAHAEPPEPPAGIRLEAARAVEAPGNRFATATAVAAAGVVAVGTVGWLYLRHWGRVPLRVPSVPYYFAFPFYVFPHPRLAVGWALAAVPVIVAVAVAVVALYRSEMAWWARVALSAVLAGVLALAVAALTGGPHAWVTPFDYAGEYPAGVGHVGAIPGFLRDFPQRLAVLPNHATGHPAGAMVFYALVARVRPGLAAAALATVAVGSLGAVAAGCLARDELGERGGRWALVLWCLSPGVVLYLATSADAVFAAVLAGAALAANRGLVCRSAGWTVAGGVLLWAASMLTFSAVLLLVFLAIRAWGQLAAGHRLAVARWAAGTAAVVAGLAGLLWLVTGYDVPAVLAAVHRAYQAAPGSAGRPLALWLPGDVVAFTGMLGAPLTAALAVRAVRVARERAWFSVDAAALATLLAAASWDFSKGEVERIFQFLIPLILVPATRQLLSWRARLPLVAALLVAQAVAVQVLFATRW